MWANLSIEDKADLVRRRYVVGEPVDVLAQEYGMNPVTLNRRLQEMRQVTIDDVKEPTQRSTSREKKAYPKVGLSAAVFDIETMDFTTGGPQSHLICCSVMPLSDKKPTTVYITFDEQRDDRRLLKETIELLSNFDILIGHNVTAFDLNWLYSRWMYHGFSASEMPSWSIYDTYQVAKSMAIRTESKGLGALGAYFGLKGVKTRIFRTDWHMVDSQDQEDFAEAMQDIVYHCEQDVILNRRLFDALWQYDPKRTFKRTKW